MDRFWAKVAKAGPHECWLWTASCAGGGYGQLKISGKAGPARAHRLAYELSVGPIPDGLHVCHVCDNPPCCNPAHLFLGTARDNAADRGRKGRTRTGWTPGSRNAAAKLDEAQVTAIRNSEKSATALSAEFGVSDVMIRNIVTRKNWKHIP